jgi:hypothetical protein
MSNVTTNTVVETLEELIQEVKADKKMELEKKVNAIVKLTANQLSAGRLNLGYQRAIARLPENATAMVPQLTVIEQLPQPSPTKQ